MDTQRQQQQQQRKNYQAFYLDSLSFVTVNRYRLMHTQSERGERVCFFISHCYNNNTERFCVSVYGNIFMVKKCVFNSICGETKNKFYWIKF